MDPGAFQHSSEQAWLTVAPGVQRMIMGYNDDMMMVKVKFEAGAVGDPHHHPHIQSSYIDSGIFEVTIDGKTSILTQGDAFFVSPNLVHGVVCREAGILIDVFNPCRKDFL